MVNKKHDLPAMPFYVGDWLKCPEVRSLAPDIRGLWFDLICFMWESTERGVMVKPNGKPYSDSEIIRMVGLDNQNSGNWLSVLLENHVCSRREDGAVFSRKMIRDEKIRVIRRESGSKGGNPSLLVNSLDKQKVNQFTEDENEYEIENITKKEREDFDQLGMFDDFFKAYPSKVERSKALRVWCVLVHNKKTQERILKSLGNYRAHLEAHSDWKQAKHPDKWLENWVDWENYIEPPKEKKYASRSDALIAKIAGK